jgi:radical SAM protein with 4Fe4S-binding SPASM domain
MSEAPLVCWVRRGHRPSCSSAGSVVGVALVTLGGAAVLLNAHADRLRRWAEGGGGGGARLRPEPEGGAEGAVATLHFPEDGAVLGLTAEGLALARAAGAREVGEGAPDRVEGARRAPEEVHLAVTERCPVACTGCYLSAGPEREGADPSDIFDELERLAELGVAEVAFGGGEALLRADLLALGQRARALGMVPNLTTSGFGLGPAEAAALAPVFGQINVSIDGIGPIYRAVRGWGGSSLGLQAIAALAAAGARVGVNTVMSRPLLATDDALEALGRAISGAGAQEWQWLRFKPAGRGAGAWSALAPAPALLDQLWPRLLQAEAALGLVMRWDCALLPFLVDHAVEPAALSALGVRGCTGGADLWARDAAGGWGPCSFAGGGPTAGGALGDRWAADPRLRAWRGRAAAPPAPCDSCAIQSACRGGCRVVAGALLGDELAPDPECPRVRRAAGV